MSNKYYLLTYLLSVLLEWHAVQHIPSHIGRWSLTVKPTAGETDVGDRVIPPWHRPYWCRGGYESILRSIKCFPT